MVDTRKSEAAHPAILIASLRSQLAITDDDKMRRTLQKALSALEAVSGSENSEGPDGVVQGVASAMLASALDASGLAVDPGELDLNENSLKVLEHRYFRKGSDGTLVEDAAGMFRRVARGVAEADRLYPSSEAGESVTDSEVGATAQAFYEMMARLEFLPNSPTLMNAGTGAGTLSACFVLPLKDSMLDQDGIADAGRAMIAVQKFGGGTGFSLSELRAKGSPISTTHGRACGPISVLKWLSASSTMVTQGGKRDGANMAVMDVHHPDILEFITCKEEEGQVHNFNISVGVDDAFMRAVDEGTEFELRDPKTGELNGSLDARGVFNQMVEGAWRNGEPGMIFLDRVNADNPTPQIGRMTATNPCGEQPLLPYESCNLGSINMARMLSYSKPKNGQAVAGVALDWGKLRRTVRLAVHFLDNVVDANQYATPEIEHMTKLTRKIGLGVMGFADMLVRLGIAYDSEDGLELGREVMRFIREEADIASMDLAEARGVYPAFKGSRHDISGSADDVSGDGSSASGDKVSRNAEVRELRLRNACRLTVAPTGTISMIAGCSSGIEPLFALAFRKQNILEGKTLHYVDEAFEAVARTHGFYSEGLMEDLSQGRSLRYLEGIPEWARRVFVTAPDISPDMHVRMQAVFQGYTDAAISKTINFPNEATIEDVRAAYLLAGELGCKGITVYRAGSREKEVLTAGTVTVVEEPTTEEFAEIHTTTDSAYRTQRRRPEAVQGLTERIRTGHGNLYVTVNFDEEGRPFELFTALGKAGGCDSAQNEAIARLVSMALRAGVDPRDVVDHLQGITCDPAWDNGVLVRSVPDGIALALKRVIGRDLPGRGQGVLTDHVVVEEDGRERLAPISEGGTQTMPPIPLVMQDDRADLAEYGDAGAYPRGNGRGGWGRCPDCSGALVFQEGCAKCHECGYNQCG